MNTIAAILAQIEDTAVLERRPIGNRSQLREQVQNALTLHNIQSINQLLEQLSELPGGVRKSIVSAIGKLHYKRATSTLIDIISNDAECRLVASIALASILSDTRATILLRQLRDCDDTSVNAAFLRAVMLAHCGRAVTELLLDVAIDIATDLKADDSLRSDAIEAIALNAAGVDRRSERFRRLAREIVRLLNDYKADVRASACYAVGLMRLQDGLQKVKVLARRDRTRVFGSVTMSVASEAKKALAHFPKGRGVTE